MSESCAEVSRFLLICETDERPAADLTTDSEFCSTCRVKFCHVPGQFCRAKFLLEHLLFCSLLQTHKQKKCHPTRPILIPTFVAKESRLQYVLFSLFMHPFQCNVAQRSFVLCLNQEKKSQVVDEPVTFLRLNPSPQEAV